jgi:phage baseplate assembly protein W
MERWKGNSSMMGKNIDFAISLPFRIDGFGNIAKTASQEEIWAGRVRSAVGTALGERVMRSDYGTKIPELFFDTQSALYEGITKEITRVFETYLPLLQLGSVDIVYDESYGQSVANITYSLPNQTNTSTAVSLVTINKSTPPYEENR